jgi:hypothetical protein
VIDSQARPLDHPPRAFACAARVWSGVAFRTLVRGQLGVNGCRSPEHAVQVAQASPHVIRQGELRHVRSAHLLEERKHVVSVLFFVCECIRRVVGSPTPSQAMISVYDWIATPLGNEIFGDHLQQIRRPHPPHPSSAPHAGDRVETRFPSAAGLAVELSAASAHKVTGRRPPHDAPLGDDSVGTSRWGLRLLPGAARRVRRRRPPGAERRTWRLRRGHRAAGRSPNIRSGP